MSHLSIFYYFVEVQHKQQVRHYGFRIGMLDRTSTVLIPGAMSNSLDRYRTIKIDGKPLFLTKDRRVKTIGGK